MKNFFEKHREIISYIFFGGLTTAVNYVIYFPLRHFNMNYFFATLIAWAGAVLFAYAVNRVFVFKSKARGRAAAREFLLFVGARVFSWGAEEFILYIFLELMHIDNIVWTADFSAEPLRPGEFIAKTTAQVVIVIMNFLFSKLVIFAKRR